MSQHSRSGQVVLGKQLTGVPSDDPEGQAGAQAFQRGLRERDSAEFIDDEGFELAGPDEARALAVINAGEALRDLGPKFWTAPEWRMWVTDESGATVCALSFSARPPRRQLTPANPQN
jgi:hypothetical protein